MYLIIGVHIFFYFFFIFVVFITRKKCLTKLRRNAVLPFLFYKPFKKIIHTYSKFSRIPRLPFDVQFTSVSITQLITRPRVFRSKNPVKIIRTIISTTVFVQIQSPGSGPTLAALICQTKPNKKHIFFLFHINTIKRLLAGSQ